MNKGFAILLTGLGLMLPPQTWAQSRPLWGTVPDSVLAQHAVRNDTSSSTMESLRKGTLFLVGGGPRQDDLTARFLKLVGGPSARVVVIPTASVEPDDSSGEAPRAADWARALGLSSVTMLHTASRKEADSEAFVEPLRHATGVWLGGGESGRILASYLGTRTERELLALLGRGGAIGGTSAGALVWGSERMVFHARADHNPYQMGRPEDLVVGDPRGVCFGVLRNVLIATHFTELQMQPSVERALSANPGLLAIGIDEATALEIHGDVCTVLGRANVTIFDGRDHDGHSLLLLKDGARYDLLKRVAL